MIVDVLVITTWVMFIGTITAIPVVDWIDDKITKWQSRKNG